jgi:hypothetical protein
MFSKDLPLTQLLEVIVIVLYDVVMDDAEVRQLYALEETDVVTPQMK